MANFTILMFFCGFIVLGFAIHKQVQLGKKPDDPISVVGIRYSRAQSRVMPWFWLALAAFSLGTGGILVPFLVRLFTRL